MTLRVTLLGTGSPSPSLSRHHPAVLVEWGGDERVLVDAGDGVVSQLLAAGTDLTLVQTCLVTPMCWSWTPAPRRHRPTLRRPGPG